MILDAVKAVDPELRRARRAARPRRRVGRLPRARASARRERWVARLGLDRGRRRRRTRRPVGAPAARRRRRGRPARRAAVRGGGRRARSERAIRRRARSAPTSARALLRDLVGARANRRHRPGRGFEALRYRFEIVSDYGAFRDLQRHRMLTVPVAALTPAPRRRACPRRSRPPAAATPTAARWRSRAPSTSGSPAPAASARRRLRAVPRLPDPLRARPQRARGDAADRAALRPRGPSRPTAPSRTRCTPRSPRVHPAVARRDDARRPRDRAAPRAHPLRDAHAGEARRVGLRPCPPGPAYDRRAHASGPPRDVGRRHATELHEDRARRRARSPAGPTRSDTRSSTPASTTTTRCRASSSSELGVGEPDHMLGVGSGTHAAQTARVMERLEPVARAPSARRRARPGRRQLDARRGARRGEARHPGRPRRGRAAHRSTARCPRRSTGSSPTSSRPAVHPLARGARQPAARGRRRRPRSTPSATR